ncbi:hypothetical protein Rhe02_37790 [Rhizocola hellebori]|uniref:Hsp70 family protein n=1 Tax=Rhizocola hellebori TaxID=1392758 RepID=A0A8J3VGZ7_9ACTN|nr:Hsp70 family protein [Rhizocola hellebori]GIH05712.1 hypothetical protein Rhe02_37790 [Rhizocola hellebori]
MDFRRTTLAVEIGAVSTVAAVDRDGRRTALVVGDLITMPTPMIDGCDLITAVTTTHREAAGPVVTALAQHLRAVAAHAGRVDVAVITAPPTFGRRHREMLTAAGQEAGLGVVQVLDEAAAVAAESFPDAPEDAVVLVCHLGERASPVSVLRRHRSGWERVATQQITEATGDRLDHVLAQQVALHTPLVNSVRDQLAHARPQLRAGRSAAVVVPGQPAPISLSPTDLQHAAQPLRQAVTDAVADTLDAADVHADRLHGAVVYGDTAAVLSPSQNDHDRLGIPATLAAQGRLAAVYGALDSVTATPSTFGLSSPRPGWSWYGSALAAPIVCAVAGGLLVWQLFDIVTRSMPPPYSRLPVDYEKLRIYFDTGIFAIAGCVLTLACLAMGRQFAAALLADRSHAAARQAGRLYAFSAVVGLAVAVLQGLLAQAVIGGNTIYTPPYLTSAMAGAAVPAVTAMAIGLAAPWLHGPPPWTERVHFPLSSIVLAVGGVLAIEAQSNRLLTTTLPRTLVAILGICGAAMLGVAIALALVTQPAARLVLATLMGTACMIIVSFDNLHSTAVVYLFTVGLWWVRRASRVVADNLPPQWRNPLGLTRNDTGDSHHR